MCVREDESSSKTANNSSEGVTSACSLAFEIYTAKGFRSTPCPSAPIWAHSTKVVPLPQNGSNTVWPGSTPKMLRIALTTCGLNFPLYS